MTLPDAFYEARITLIPKLDKNITRIKKNYRTISFFIYGCKTPQKHTSKPKPTTYKKDHTTRPSTIYPANAKL